MPDELRDRVDDAVARGVATPERLCFTLLSQLWREIELDFMLAVSDRTASVLSGGCSWKLRAERQAESQLTRAARMVGMLYRRLDTKDTAGSTDTARVVEDSRVGVEWSVIEDYGAVLMSGLRAETLPWQGDPTLAVPDDGSLVVVPRPMPTRDDVDLVRSLQAPSIFPVLVVPGDSYDANAHEAGGVPCSGITVLACPERLGELDLAIEAILLSSRMSRQ